MWWEVTKDPVSQKGVIETSMAASLPTAGIRVERRIQLLDAEAVFLATESITNDNTIGRIYNIVQHPSIAGVFLDEKTVVDCNGTTGFTQHETLPNPQERVVQWPNALNDQDQSVDIRFLGEDTEPEVVSYVVEDEYGWVIAVSPSTRLMRDGWSTMVIRMTKFNMARVRL